MRKHGIHYVTVLMIALCVAGSALADQIIFQDGLNGYGSTRDATLYGGSALRGNFGGHVELWAMGAPYGGHLKPGLIRFDDTFGPGANQVPDGVLITSAKMYLYAGWVYPYEWFYVGLWSMESPWVEGSDVGNAEEGASCGEARRYRADGDYANHPEDAWGTDGLARPGTATGDIHWCLGPARGVDFPDAVWVDTTVIPSSPGWMEFDVTNQVRGDYEGSLDSWGYYMQAAGYWQGAIFHSSDSPYDPCRPKLIVDYTDPPAIPEGTYRFKQGLDGYLGCEDTYINGLPNGPGNFWYHDFGAEQESHFSGVPGAPGNLRPGLIKFKDVVGAGPGQVPAGTDISYAALRIYVRKNNDTYMNLFAMESDWEEGDNLETNDGHSCYAVRHYHVDPCDYVIGDYWGTDGQIHAGPVQGVDWYNETTFQAISHGPPCPGGDCTGVEGWAEFDVTPIVQAWVEGTMDNHGFYGMSFAANDYFIWDSSESGAVLLRPELIVQGPICGDPCHPEPPGDVNGDCFVNGNDVVDMAEQWLDCTDPQGEGCVQVETPDEVMYMHHCYDRTVDGLLGDWTDPCWVPLDQVYFGDPCDLTSAKYTVCWDPCSDMFFTAVVVEDNDQVFESIPTNWNTSDRIEIYVQADPNGGDTWGDDDSQNHDRAQQYVVGYEGVIQGDTWAVFGNGQYIPGEAEPGNAGFLDAGRTSGTTVTYEAGAVAYIWYGGATVPFGSVPNEVRQLAPGQQVGFDLVVDSRWGPAPHEVNDGEFGMLSNNLDTEKYIYADRFQRWELLNYDGSIVPPECGEWGYLPADVNPVPDCYVDLGDFLQVAVYYWSCTDPTCD